MSAGTAVAAPRPRVWECKVGIRTAVGLLSPADPPMRDAVAQAFRGVTGHEPDFLFTGWGGQLTEGELAVVEGRDPEPPAEAELLEDMGGAPYPDDVQVAHRLALARAIAEAEKEAGARALRLLAEKLRRMSDDAPLTSPETEAYYVDGLANGLGDAADEATRRAAAIEAGQDLR